MSASPIRWIGFWVCVWAMSLGGAGLSLSADPVPPSAPSPDVVPGDVMSLVGDLSSGEFTRRNEAERTLSQRGPAVFDSLITALDTVPIEAGRRILTVLEEIWLQTPEPDADRLERRLEVIRLVPGPYQPDMTRILFAHHQLREQRAARALRRLNAIVETDIDENSLELQNQLGEFPRVPPERVSQIIFPRTWKGTEADLWHLQRLAHLKVLLVYVVKGNAITADARRRMSIGFPDIVVSERAEIYIGVIGAPVSFDNRSGCHVTDVQFDSPADIAGLLPGDLIQSVNQQPIKNFNELIESLKTKRAYEPLELKVDRFGQMLDITLIGAPWETKSFLRPPRPPETEPLIEEPLDSPYLRFPLRKR